METNSKNINLEVIGKEVKKSVLKIFLTSGVMYFLTCHSYQYK